MAAHVIHDTHSGFMSRASSSRDANWHESAHFLHERFSGFGQNTLVGHKIRWHCGESRTNLFRIAFIPNESKSGNGSNFWNGNKSCANRSGLFRSLWRKNCYLPENSAVEFLPIAQSAHAYSWKSRIG